MRAYNCGIRAACQRIALGRKADRVPILTRRKVKPNFTPYTVGSPWKGQKATSLETRYNRWSKRDKERQRKLTVKIITSL
jgi:hypothetical protein